MDGKGSRPGKILEPIQSPTMMLWFDKISSCQCFPCGVTGLQGPSGPVGGPRHDDLGLWVNVSYVGGEKASHGQGRSV